MTDEPADGPADEEVLEPADLDVTTDEHVTELEDNRFVVSLDEKGIASSEPLPGGDEDAAADGADVPGDGDEESDREPESTDSLADVSAPYAVSLAARTEGEYAAHVVSSHNVVQAFEEVVRWYATQVGDDGTPPEEVVRILLEASDLDG